MEWSDRLIGRLETRHPFAAVVSTALWCGFLGLLEIASWAGIAWLATGYGNVIADALVLVSLFVMLLARFEMFTPPP